MSFGLAFLLSALCAAVSGMAVSLRYEWKLRNDTFASWKSLSAEYERLTEENALLREEVARQKGIGTGRVCDTLQRKMADSLTDGGSVAFSFSRRRHNEIKLEGKA